jgi:hypothetical protein
MQRMAPNERAASTFHKHVEEVSLTTVAPLTHDEYKAAEAAFRGLPMNPRWSRSAQDIYLGILAVTNGRDIVADTETSALAVGA